MALDNEEAPLDPAAERLRRKLARLLLVSGGIMLLGFIAVFAAIVYKLGALGEAEDASAPAPGNPVEATIRIPSGARLVSADLDGDRALMAAERSDGATELLLVDLHSGAVLGRYRLAPD
jgi:hypothetical protein